MQGVRKDKSVLPVSADAQSAAVQNGSLEGLLAQFDSNPFGTSRALRQLCDADPGHFVKSALRAISTLPDQSGIRFITTLVPLSEPVLEMIADPQGFEEDGAKRIVEAMRRIDPQAEAKLLRLISANPAQPLPPKLTDRILDLVDAVSKGPRLVPVLMQIFRSANPYLRARLSLSIGKHHRNKDWIEDRMRDPDPRVRANAVEANWHQRDEQALCLFAIALRDSHHRVASNGAVGLYFAGDSRSLRALGELLHHGETARRAAGLWAIGHVQETRFEGLLARLASERDPMLRRLLVIAQEVLKRTIEVRVQQPRLDLRLIKATRQPVPPATPPPPDGAPACHRNHLFLEVKNPGGATPWQGLKPLQFHIFENGQPILDYAVQERTSYIKPGTYDLYFDSTAKPTEVHGNSAGVRHLRIVVVTETASGEHETFDFGEPQSTPKAVEHPSEAGSAWAVLRS